MSGSVNELACVYSALILYDDGIEVTADKIQTLCKAADVPVDAIWPKLFAKALEGKDIGALLSNVGSATAAAPVGGGATTTTESTDQGDKKEEKKEEKKPESEEESDDDMGFGLFD